MPDRSASAKGLDAVLLPSLVDRTRLGGAILVALLTPFVLADPLLSEHGASAGAVQFGRIAVLAAGQLWLWRRPTEQVALVVSVASALAMAVASAAVAVLRGDDLSTAMFLTALCWGAATLLPWGVRAQAVVSTVSLVSLAAAGYLIDGRPFGSFAGPASLTFFFGVMIPVYVAWQLEGNRRRLTARLAEARVAEDEVRRLNETLERSVRERTSELLAANEELEEFSYSVAHDLRGPLRSIGGFAELLIDEYGGRLDERGVDHLERVRAAAIRMGRLIDDLLTLARVNRRRLTRTTTDLSAMASEVCVEMASYEPDRDVTVDIAPDLLGDADPTLLRVLLQNLIGNAWKFTRNRDRPRIGIGGERRGDAWVYRVEDNGVGFDERFKDRLFLPFERLHPDSDFEGTGIGLATVHRIVARHGGLCWAESTLGEGATFYFTLPLVDPRA